jgi:hypothetical protein
MDREEKGQTNYVAINQMMHFGVKKTIPDLALR